MTLDATPLLAPRPVTITVELAPLLNQLNSLAALKSAPFMSGLADWIYQTERQLTDQERDSNRLLFAYLGLPALAAALPPDALTLSLESFLTRLAVADASQFRDRCLAAMLADPLPSLGVAAAMPPVQPAELLAEASRFVDYFNARFEFGTVAEWSALYERMQRPEELLRQIQDHLQTLWQKYLRAEWARVESRVRGVVARREGLIRPDQDIWTTLQAVTGRNLAAIASPAELGQFSRIVCVPTPHNGPYLTPIPAGATLYLLFGIPAPDAPVAAPIPPDVVVGRLQALGDEVRLAILMALQTAGELSTPAIMAQFDLSKSATSRHLRFLQATELVEVRREDKTLKLYRVNRAALAELRAFLGTLA
ncbi:MAG: helix-turn-helix transcriptional regulator [Ardenticatenales bacterium]|nr:helix-turn-helix transcriptional regulator [Ardenticatenales bacterium]